MYEESSLLAQAAPEANIETTKCTPNSGIKIRQARKIRLQCKELLVWFSFQSSLTSEGLLSVEFFTGSRAIPGCIDVIFEETLWIPEIIFLKVLRILRTLQLPYDDQNNSDHENDIQLESTRKNGWVRERRHISMLREKERDLVIFSPLGRVWLDTSRCNRRSLWTASNWGEDWNYSTNAFMSWYIFGVEFKQNRSSSICINKRYLLNLLSVREYRAAHSIDEHKDCRHSWGKM